MEWYCKMQTSRHVGASVHSLNFRSCMAFGDYSPVVVAGDIYIYISRGTRVLIGELCLVQSRAQQMRMLFSHVSRALVTLRYCK